MIRPQFSLDLNRELIVDNFAGGGGASTGIELALGRHVDHARNHSAEALGMHRINHPQTIHHCEDIFEGDPHTLVEGRPVGLSWFSPDCKHFSKAKGGKPLDKMIRGLVYVMFIWAKYRTRVMFMENVEEIKTLGPLFVTHNNGCNGKRGHACKKGCHHGRPIPEHKGRGWQCVLDILGAGVRPDHPDLPEIIEVMAGKVTKSELVRGFGYYCETRELRACDYGAPTIRKRLFMVARCDGSPIIWPEPTHADPKKKSKSASGAARNLLPWRTIAECIDWERPCPSIFLNKAAAKAARCRRPLAKSTLRRIATGIDRYVLKAKEPFLVSLTHQGGDRVEAVSEPAKTLTGAHRGEKALVAPTLAEHPTSNIQHPTSNGERLAPFYTEHANSSNQRNCPADEPLRTQCANVKGGHFALVAGTMVQTGYGENEGQKPRALDIEKPLGTIVSGGKHAVVSANLMVNTTHHTGAPSDAPAPTIPTGGHHALVTGTLVGAGGPAYSGKPKPVDKPFQAMTTENHSSFASVHLTKFTTGGVGQDLREPGPTICAGTHSPETHGGAASTLGIVAANLVKLRGGVETHNKPESAGEPLGVVSAGGTHHGLATGTLIGAGGRAAQSRPRGVDEPNHTGTAKADQCLATAYLAQHNNTTNPGHAATEPVSTLSSKGSQQQVVMGSLAAYYGNDEDGQAVDEPLRTVTTKERFGFVESTGLMPMTAEQLDGARRVAAFLREHGVIFAGEFATVAGFVIVDIGMRMLTPRELFRAQGFPAEYVINKAWVVDPATGELVEITLTKEQQIRMCGNSVCPPVSCALVRANVPELAVWNKSERKKLRARSSRRTLVPA